MFNIVEEIVSICSFQQLQEMCFMSYQNSSKTIVDMATPKCRELLSRALRYLGRFEFIGNGPIFSDLQTGFKAFDALDYGSDNDDDDEPTRVLLECYRNEYDFENRVSERLPIELLYSSYSSFVSSFYVLNSRYFRCILCWMWN
jgi:hypothetical protein